MPAFRSSAIAIVARRGKPAVAAEKSCPNLSCPSRSVDVCDQHDVRDNNNKVHHRIFRLVPGSSRKSVSASMAGMARLVLAAVLFPAQTGASCLPEAINTSQRKYLTNANGESYPIGMYIGAWDASFLTTHLLKIIIED